MRHAPFKLIAALVFVGCQSSIPPGIEPITIYVVDAVSGGALCNATVTLNNQAMTAGGGQTVGCYFVPTQTLNVGDSYAVAVSQTDYVSQTEMGTIPQDGLSLTVQLVPITSDAGVDASSDASDAAGDAAGDVSTE